MNSLKTLEKGLFFVTDALIVKSSLKILALSTCLEKNKDWTKTSKKTPQYEKN
jgi:hypothetical protein